MTKAVPRDPMNEDFDRIKAEAVFMSIGDGAISADAQGHVERVNQAALDMLGFTEEEMIGKWFPSILSAEDEDGNKIETLDRPITKAFVTGKPVNERAYYICKDGSRLPVALTVSPLVVGGKPIGAVEIFRDITHELEVDHMKSEFISIASHQLRTPLSAIKIYSQMLADGYGGTPSVEQKEFLDIVVSSANRMNELIDTLLDITRLEAGKIIVTPKTVKLGFLLKELYQEFNAQAHQKQQKFSMRTATAPTCTDPLLIKEVFANLISNAIKYTPQGGSINAQLVDKNKEYVFMIKDTGHGIPEEAQSRIFTKFFRAPNVVNEENEGTGLGLYMIREIANLLGGKLWFKSTEGVGSIFYFSVPKAGPSATTSVKKKQLSVKYKNKQGSKGNDESPSS